MRDAHSQILKIVVLGIVLVLSTTTSAYAQTERGALELGVEVGPALFIATGGGEAIGGLLYVGEPNVHYFLTRELAVGVSGSFYRNIEGDGSRLFFGAVYGDINYSFSSSSRVSPYIGARIGVFTLPSVTIFGLGPQLGLKYFVNRQLSINGQLAGAAHIHPRGVVYLASVVLGLSYYL